MLASRAFFLMAVAVFGMEASKNLWPIMRETREGEEDLEAEDDTEGEKIIAGTSNGRDFSSCKYYGRCQRRETSSFRSHPQYKYEEDLGRNSLYDIAVMLVEFGFIINDHIGIIGLWNKPWPSTGKNLGSKFGTLNCTAFSWGSVRRHTPKFCQYELRSVNVSARNGRLGCACTRNIWWEDHFFICAGGDGHPGGICENDSGGALICDDLLAGVFYSYQDSDCSGEPECADPLTFGTYTYICPLLGFIHEHVTNTPGMPEYCDIKKRPRLPSFPATPETISTSLQPDYQLGWLCDEPQEDNDYNDYYDYDRAARSLDTTWLFTIAATIDIFGVIPWQN